MRCCAILILLGFLLMTGNAFTQTRRFELFAGYSPLRNFSDGALVKRKTLHGWNASLTTDIKPWLGISADFSGHYDGRTAFVNRFLVDENGRTLVGFVQNEFMSHWGIVGPQVKLRHGRFEPFSRLLFGVSRVSVEGSKTPPDVGFGFNKTGFALALGGGLDFRISERVKIRLIQADYMRSDTRIGRENLRTSFGLVIPF
jgi:hypothetical protein